MIVNWYWYGSDLGSQEVDMVLPRIESKKKREGPAGRAGTATLEKGLQDFSSDQEQARGNDRHVQHAVIVSGASKDQQQITTVHLVSFALHAASLITLQKWLRPSPDNIILRNVTKSLVLVCAPPFNVGRRVSEEITIPDFRMTPHFQH